MDPEYFSSALDDLSETLKPYIDVGVTENLNRLVLKLQIEYPNLAIQRYSILDEKSKPHCVAFDFELDLIFYLHISCNFDSAECVREIKDIVLTWNISDFEDIQGGFQFIFEGVTVNLLLARDMVLTERRKPRQYSNTSWYKLEDAVSKREERGSRGQDPNIVVSDDEFHLEDNVFLEDAVKLYEAAVRSDSDNMSNVDEMSAGSEIIFDEEDSVVEEKDDQMRDTCTTTTMKDMTLTDGKQGREETEEGLLGQLIQKQCEKVLSHIEEQTATMSDQSDKLFVIESLGKRYGSSLVECYHHFFASQSAFCVSFIRICKYWCLKVFLNRVHFGLLRYVEALAVYICSRKEYSNDFHVIFLDFLLALKKYKSIRIDFSRYNKRSSPVKEKFRPPFITDVSFPYSNILKEITVRDFESLAEASDEFLKSMRMARCFSALFSVPPYPSWLVERLEPFYFVFQPSDSMSIQISIHSSKKDLIPDDFLPGLSSRLYLWRQCAIADTRRHQANESGSFYRAVSGLVMIEFIKSLDAQEVSIPESAVHAARHKIVVSFPDYSHSDQVYRCRVHRRSFLSSLLCGRCSDTARQDQYDYYQESEHVVIASPYSRTDSFSSPSRTAGLSSPSLRTRESFTSARMTSRFSDF